AESDSSTARLNMISLSSKSVASLLKLAILLERRLLSLRSGVAFSWLSQKLSFEIRNSISFNLFSLLSKSKIAFQLDYFLVYIFYVLLKF
ncbi:MAG: hypothetical protein KKD47_11990, partial [Proteobacteria bacterium]|nr:hypothetical protein [Pseudomonadota bacterium]